MRIGRFLLCALICIGILSLGAPILEAQTPAKKRIPKSSRFPVSYEMTEKASSKKAHSKKAKTNPKKRVKSKPLVEIKTVPEGATLLLAAIQSGKITLTNGSRDQAQLAVLAKSGQYLWPALRTPSPKPARPIANFPRVAEVPSPLIPADSQQDQIDSQLSPEETSVRPSQSERASGHRLKGVKSPSRHAPPGFRSLKTMPPPEVSPSPLLPDTPGYVACTPSIGLLNLLSSLSQRSTPEKPLELMSLLRPPYRTAGFQHAGARNPHSLGMAADIACYQGLRFRQSRPNDCILATVALLNDLPKGSYRVGMPKAPEGVNSEIKIGFSDFLADTLPPEIFNALTVSPSRIKPVSTKSKSSSKKRGSRKSKSEISPQPASLKGKGALLGALAGVHFGRPVAVWPFFPAPRREAITDWRGRQELRTLFANESYAPEEALASSRVRAALAKAKKRGVNVVALFPDAADHIHIDVRNF